MLLHPTLKKLIPFTLIFLLTTGFLAGCATGPSQEEITATHLDIANQSIAVGDYTAAAEEFLKLADASPAVLKDDTPSNLKQVYQLTAVETYIQGKNSLRARKTMVQIDRSLLDAQLNRRYLLDAAKIAELDQHPEQVVQQLEQIDLLSVTPETQKEILQMQISAFDSLESPMAASQARSLIDSLLETTNEQADNRRALWSTIEQIDAGLLTDQASNASPQLRGWITLNLLARDSIFDATLFNKKVDAWRLRFPNHAAETPVLEELLVKSNALGKKVENIALLLPNSGRFAQAGAAVRDGFLSAWYGENDQLEQPMVHVYEADANNILDAYQRAVDEGIDLVVGPLEKSALRTLLSLPELPVKTLALNQLSEEELTEFSSHINSNHFYQFGLSPEQEAQQVAEKAWTDGFTHALAITPEGTWGDRLYTAFLSKYEELGGAVVEHQKFSTTEADFSGSVTKLLDIDNSQQRLDQLTNDLNRRIKFEPRPRNDMDFIFMAARPIQARQIRPQLLFHRASGVPVLTTSHAFGIPPRGEPDLDLEGVIIGEMPWMIRNQDINPEMPLSMQQNWPDNNAAFLRLFALGIDAYKVIPHLGRLKIQVGGSYVGDTGNLSLNDRSQIQRELSWAKFARGKPEFIESKTQKDPMLDNIKVDKQDLTTISESQESNNE